MHLVEGRAAIDDVEAFVADLQEIGDRHDATVQAFNARYIAGREHLERAVELAQRAWDRDDAIAREESVEILLYAAGRRQINRAMEMGVSEGECPVVAVVAGGEEDDAAAEVSEYLTAADTLAAGEPERIREFFDIGETELETTDASLEELVCERVALLVVEK